MKSLEKLTVDVLDAALEGFAFDELNPDRTALSEDGKQEIGIMDKLYSESLQLQGTFLAFEDLINNKYKEEYSVLEKIQVIFKTGFIVGWNARGAIEESAALKKLFDTSEGNK